MDKKFCEAVKNLPFKTKAIYSLNVLAGFKYKEIAKLLNISVDSVKVSIHNARRKLINQGLDIL